MHKSGARRPFPAARPSRRGATAFRADALEARRLLAAAAAGAGLLDIPTGDLRRGPHDFTDIWQPLARPERPGPSAVSYLNVRDFDAFRLDAADLRATLKLAPVEFTADAARPVEVTLPTPDGDAARFAVVETPVMDPLLAAKFPGIKTYRGEGIDDPAASVRLDLTPLGFHAQVLSPGRTFYVEPYWHRHTGTYASYWRADVAAKDVAPGLADDVDRAHDHRDASGADAAVAADAAAFSSGTVLRTYRTAVAATGEYTTFHGGTVAAGQAAIVTAVNRVTGIYETELSIRLQLVGNNSSLVYTNKNQDPYNNANPSLLLSQNQSNIDSVIGSANYDLGHVFSTGGGGLAALGVVGLNGAKARGETGLPSPTGDAFYVDYVAHEMGHQFGANHTFNTANDTGNRNANTAYEPGSGSTIMAYAGLEGTDNLQLNSDPYFAWKSLDEIITYVDVTRPGAGTRAANGNLVPTVNAGPDYTIPAATPFALTATGSDGNGDALTYSWEQADLGPATFLTTADNGSSPLFRVYNPTSSPTRTFPKLGSILTGANGTAAPSGGGLVERLPTVARAMKFRVTARDNRAGGSGVDDDEVVVNVVNTGAAFLVTSHNSAATLPGGSTQTVTWNIAGTTSNGINAANVNIRLSTDGGNTFPILLAGNTPNDGTQAVQLPFNTGSTTARIKVEPTNNVFFDINNASLTITNVPDTPSATPGTPDLVPGFDTGLANNDDKTNRDNSTGAKNLQFTVTGTVSGATVSLYSGATFIGSAVATGTTTPVTTNGTVDLADGVRAITARQTEPGKLESGSSAALNVTIDTAGGTVGNVFVAGTAWTAAYRGTLVTTGTGEAAFGYRVDTGEQARTLAWANLDQLSIRFSEPVSVAADDLVVNGVNVAAYGLAVVNPFTYDAATLTATWTLDRVVPSDKLALNLDGDDGTDGLGVKDVAGNLLDGEWANPVFPALSADTFPSGNGSPAGDFLFHLRVLPGDVNRDGAVNLSDYNILRPNLNLTGQGVTGGDLNGDNLVDLVDYNLYRANLNKIAPV